MEEADNAQGILRRAAVSGTVSGLAAALVAALAGKRELDSYAAALNATSHILWGDKAAHSDKVSLKYTVTGFSLNHASAIFWALFYEKVFGLHGMIRRTGTIPVEAGPVAKPILGGATVAAAAYVIDYHLIPKRFTPGFEKRLSGKSLGAIFAALAIGLAARDVVDSLRK
jgi:hypothetical protein